MTPPVAQEPLDARNFDSQRQTDRPSSAEPIQSHNVPGSKCCTTPGATVEETGVSHSAQPRACLSRNLSSAAKPEKSSTSAVPANSSKANAPGPADASCSVESVHAHASRPKQEVLTESTQNDVGPRTRGKQTQTPNISAGARPTSTKSKPIPQSKSCTAAEDSPRRRSMTRKEAHAAFRRAYRGARIIKLKADGSCGYRSLSKALKGTATKHPEVRQELCDYQAVNFGYFLTIYRVDVPTASAETFRRRIAAQRILVPGRTQWAERVDFVAASEVYNVQIVFYSPCRGSSGPIAHIPMSAAEGTQQVHMLLSYDRATDSGGLELVKVCSCCGVHHLPQSEHCAECELPLPSKVHQIDHSKDSRIYNEHYDLVQFRGQEFPLSGCLNANSENSLRTIRAARLHNTFADDRDAFWRKVWPLLEASLGGATQDVTARSAFDSLVSRPDKLAFGPQSVAESALLWLHGARDEARKQLRVPGTDATPPGSRAATPNPFGAKPALKREGVERGPKSETMHESAKSEPLLHVPPDLSNSCSNELIPRSVMTLPFANENSPTSRTQAPAPEKSPSVHNLSQDVLPSRVHSHTHGNLESGTNPTCPRQQQNDDHGGGNKSTLTVTASTSGDKSSGDDSPAFLSTCVPAEGKNRNLIGTNVKSPSTVSSDNTPSAQVPAYVDHANTDSSGALLVSPSTAGDATAVSSKIESETASTFSPKLSPNRPTGNHGDVPSVPRDMMQHVSVLDKTMDRASDDAITDAEAAMIGGGTQDGDTLTIHNIVTKPATATTITVTGDTACTAKTEPIKSAKSECTETTASTELSSHVLGLPHPLVSLPSKAITNPKLRVLTPSAKATKGGHLVKRVVRPKSAGTKAVPDWDPQSKRVSGDLQEFSKALKSKMNKEFQTANARSPLPWYAPQFEPAQNSAAAAHKPLAPNSAEESMVLSNEQNKPDMQLELVRECLRPRVPHSANKGALPKPDQPDADRLLAGQPQATQPAASEHMELSQPSEQAQQAVSVLQQKATLKRRKRRKQLDRARQIAEIRNVPDFLRLFQLGALRKALEGAIRAVNSQRALHEKRAPFQELCQMTSGTFVRYLHAAEQDSTLFRKGWTRHRLALDVVDAIKTWDWTVVHSVDPTAVEGFPKPRDPGLTPLPQSERGVPLNSLERPLAATANTIRRQKKILHDDENNSD